MRVPSAARARGTAGQGAWWNQLAASDSLETKLRAAGGQLVVLDLDFICMLSPGVLSELKTRDVSAWGLYREPRARRVGLVLYL